MNETEIPQDPIYSYSRAQAIEDGVLVDVSELAREAGFAVPVALTAAVWADCVEWDEADTRRQVPQDEAGRLWDVLWMGYLAMRRARGSELLFSLYRVPRGGRGRTPRPVALRMTIGPGDSFEPLVMVMMRNED
jgi:hypothetical protein